MIPLPIYLDNHATTRVDPRVVQAMLPLFETTFGNAGSTSHTFGHQAKAAVDTAREQIAAALGTEPREIIFTSGATESNNLAIRGVAERHRRRGNHLVSVTTEHKAVLDPIAKLGRRDFEVTWLSPQPAGHRNTGQITAEQVAAALRDDTILVSVMLANNEIGVLQPIAEIAQVCRARGVLLHCDATQAVGKLPIDVQALGADLLSFSAHKIYGPKGVGALYVRRRVRLDAQIDGGGQEGGLRSGTLNSPGIVGFAKALQLCQDEMPTETPRLLAMRNALWDGLHREDPACLLNGPALDDQNLRLHNNLNVTFPGVDGEALIINLRDLAVSSGSACTSANPEPSHVLRAIGLSEDQTRASLRFGLGRFNTPAEIDFAIGAIGDTIRRLRRLA